MRYYGEKFIELSIFEEERGLRGDNTDSISTKQTQR